MDVLVILLLSGLAPGLTPGDQGQARDGSPLPPAGVAVKHTEPVRVAYLEHIGPYWMVGPVFRRVGQYMLDNDQSGPIFVRYLDNPAEVPAKVLRGEIGFFVEGDLRPDPPFEGARREPELVAFLVADGQYVKTRRSYSTLYAWIEANGHRAVGPITEIYLNPFAARGEPGTQRTEIQIALVRPKETAPRTSASPGSTRDSRTSMSDNPEAVEGSVGTAPGAGAIGAIKDSSTSTTDPPDAVQASVGMAPGEGAIKDSRTSIDSRTGMTEPRALAGEEPKLTIKDLIEAARFDQVAKQLMPVEHEIPPGLQVWFGQVIFRIGAAAKGIKQVYPGEEEGLAGLADALIRRYRVVSADFKLDPLDQVVMRVDRRADPLAGRKKAIMHALDNLLAGIALRTVGAKEAVEILTTMLESVYDLIRVNRGQP